MTTKKSNQKARGAQGLIALLAAIFVYAFNFVTNFDPAIHFLLALTIRIWAGVVASHEANIINRSGMLWGWLAFFFPIPVLIIVLVLSKKPEPQPQQAGNPLSRTCYHCGRPFNPYSTEARCDEFCCVACEHGY